MSDHPQDSVEGLLLESLSRDLVLAVDEAMHAGALRAHEMSEGMNDGHRANALGQNRHFKMNETFHMALQAAGTAPSSIKGNDIIVGQAGMFRLARFNIPEGFWINGRRSQLRKQMSLANQALEPLVQDDLFDTYQRPASAVAFFVSVFSGSLKVSPQAPNYVAIAVPNRDMTGWLFREPLRVFAARFDAAPKQVDNVKPTLKARIRKDDSTGTRAS